MGETKKEKSWHSIAWQEAAEELQTNVESGLSQEAVIERRKVFGRNTIPEEKTPSKIKTALHQLKNPLIYILIAAAFFSFFLKEFADGIIITSVILLNSLIGFIQENKVNNALKKLKKIIKIQAQVLRAGNLKVVDSEELVPGDIIILSPGDKVPADARIIESFDLKVNEMSLTGEWLSSEKENKSLPEKTPLADRDNLVFMGTVAEEGRAKCVVFATGLNTEIGKIAQIIGGNKHKKTPLQKKLLVFARVLGVIILALSFIIFIEGILTGKSAIEMFSVSVAMAVAAIPECLPTVMTVILAVGMQKILRKKGLVRNLLAAETLGGTSIICTDKTKTLTEGEMRVAEILGGNEVLGEGKGSHDLDLKIAVLASDAFIENPDDTMKKWIIRGSSTEKALLLAAVESGINKKKLESGLVKTVDLPFDSKNKYSAKAYETKDGKDIIYFLGAPEKLLKISKFLNVGGELREINDSMFNLIRKNFENLAEKGLRVVAVAYKEINHLKDLFNNLVFVGLIALKDPLRKETKKAIEMCRLGGMKPIIVTGDHKLTAVAIAKELGFAVEEENILDGEALDDISDNELEERLEKIQIYARVEPKHKNRIIEAWQKRGLVTAMTGDGVNDAPALKNADIGIALGSGTEVAKESSDLILLNDSFSIIVAAVEEGRRIMDNIRKVITYLLVGGFTEITLIGLSIIFRLPLPVLAGQILWKNMIESTPPAMALAFEPKEKEIMRRLPEKPKSPLLTREMNVLIFIIGILTNFILFGIFIWFLKNQFSLAVIRSAMFVGLSIDSFLFAFSCRNLRKNIWQYNPFDNSYINLAIFIGFMMLFLALYFPIFQALLKTTAIGIFEWSILISFGLLNLILIEAAKWVFIKTKRTD